MGEKRMGKILGKIQFLSIFILASFFIIFEFKVGIRNYIFYKSMFNYLDYLNDNIVLLFSVLFLLFAGISILYSSVDRLDKTIAMETFLLASIFLVWSLMYKGRSYYYYGIILGITLNTIQNIKLLFLNYN